MYFALPNVTVAIECYPAHVDALSLCDRSAMRAGHVKNPSVAVSAMQGLPVVRAPSEAEATAAALNAAGLAHAVFTTDSDALLFGATTVYKQLHLNVRTRACQPAGLSSLCSRCL